MIPKTTLKDLNYWHVTIIIALLVSYVFIKPFLATIGLAALAAFIFNPFYKKLLNLLKGKRGVATLLTTLFSFVVIGIPVAAILGITFLQANTLINNFQSGKIGGLQDASITDILDAGVDKINSVAASTLHRPELIKVSDVTEFVTSKLPEVANYVVHFITTLASSFPQFFTLLILYLFLFIAFLQNSKKIIADVRALSPFNKETNDMYLHKISAMTRAMVKGQLVIALLQGTMGALSLAVVGFEEYFFFAWIVLTFLSFIPLGGGIIVIPVGGLLLATGHVWQGLIILGVHFLLTTNIDNLLRPKLVPKDAHLPAALTLLAAFAGVAHFGFLGVIYGPIIMIVLLTTLETYKKTIGKSS